MNRRRFLRYLRQSPLYAMAAEMAGQSPASALEVFEFIPIAQKNIQSQHWAYLMGGSDDNATVRANEEAYSKWRIRARRHVDMTKIDLTVDLFGQRLAHPLILAPAAAREAFHPDGESATARGAAAKKAQMILSTNASRNVRQVAKDYGGALWFQLYSFSDFEVNRALVRNAEEIGCAVLAVTADSVGGSPRIMQTRGGVKTEQRCKACHDASEQGYYKEHGNFDGIDMTRALVGGPGRAVTWTVLEKLRAATKMKIVVKGVMTAEDASAAYRAGVDGLIVSNHGGRAENSMQGTLDALPEIVEVINGRIPVIVDGGIRRGVDIFKALALGASAVGIGRPYIWGLGAYGQAGVEKVIDLLLAELRGIMGSAGTTAVRHISPLSIERRV